MLGFISKKKLHKKIEELYKANNTEKSNGVNDYYFNCGCANVCNALCSYFGLPKVDKRCESESEDKE